MILSLLIVIFFSPVAYAEWERSGDFTLETRQFADDNEDDTYENQRAIEVHYRGKGQFGKNFFTLSYGGRYDDQDRGRNLLWPEDIYLNRQMSDNVNFVVGYQIFNYSYMEAFHPLDVVNAVILDVSLVNVDKMGEFVIGTEIYAWDGNLRLYLMPRPTRPVLPGRDSRLNLDIDFHRSVWIGQDGEEQDWSDHFLVSFEKSFDDFDLMIVTSKGMDRQRFFIGTEKYTEFNGNVFPDNADLFTPFYFERFFSGMNTVYNFNSFQLKGSVAYSYYLAEDEIYTAGGLQRPHDYTVTALGFEKEFSHDGGIDSTLIVEGQKAFVDDADIDNFALQNDMFIGWRFAFNDVNSKELTIATMIDLSKSDHEGFSQFIYSQRFMESWRFEFFIIDYYIPAKSNINALGLFEDKEHASFKFTRFF